MGATRRPKVTSSPAAARRACFMVIRVWVEPGEGGMRGRIVRSPDATGDEQEVIAISTPEALYEGVQDWLEDFLTSRTVEGSIGEA